MKNNISLTYKELSNVIEKRLFDIVPISVVILDEDFNIIHANKAFEQLFGEWEKQKCYKVYKNRDSRCDDCKVTETFEKGISCADENVGYDKNGRLVHYVRYAIPVIKEDGKIQYAIEMSIDITETKQIRKEHRLLFDQVPCSILLIDRDFKIARANKHLRESLGNLEGRHCYSALKGFNRKCNECTASQTFADGKMHTGHHVWKAQNEGTLHSQVTTVPLKREDGTFDLVMEMAVDLTQTLKLEDELTIAHSFLEAMISTSIDGIIAVDARGEVTVFNRSAKKMLDISFDHNVTKEELSRLLPKGFMAQVAAGPGHVYLPEAEINTKNDIKIPVRLAGIQLGSDDRSIGMAFSIQDLREIKELEKAKLESERLAAVGQTVAGLAHGVKNLIASLEGGMYMLNTGMGKGNIERIGKGMEMLGRNINRISMFVKAFLDFSKGREIQVKICNPVDIVEDVIDIYSARAEKLGIQLKSEPKGKIRPASMDYESMHECLTNLVGNAIDACRLADKESGRHVTLRTYEENEHIIFEITDDGCGMDYEVGQKVFTNFFTTKGLGGTGIGLLMTKKIIHEHGGSIKFESIPGEGTTFRIILPRHRLPIAIED